MCVHMWDLAEEEGPIYTVQVQQSRAMRDNQWVPYNQSNPPPRPELWVTNFTRIIFDQQYIQVRHVKRTRPAIKMGYDPSALPA